MEHAAWLNDAIVFLVAAGIVVPFFHRARIGAVLGFLLVGVVVGPYGLGRFVSSADWVALITIEDPENVGPFAEWGVIFLLFLLGLESSASKLWEFRRYVFGVGTLQVAVGATAIGGLGYLIGLPANTAIVLGLCLALSSTAIVMQILIDEGRVATLTGRIALAVLLFQDLMVVPILFVTGMLSGGTLHLVTLGVTLAQGLVAVAGILILGRFLVRPLLRFAAQTGSRDLIMAISLLIVVGAAGATGAAGLSSALGAFLAGLLLSNSEYKHQVEIDIEPFKGLLLGLFFTTVGMMLDPMAVLDNAAFIVAGVAALLVVKAATFAAVARIFKVPLAITAELALLLAQGGEFAFVVIGLARSTDLLSGDIANGALAVVALSMMITPLLAVAARNLGHRVENASHAAHGPDGNGDHAGHIIIGGFGRVGQAIAALLESENVPYLALDTDGDIVTDHRKRRRPIFFGDASRGEMLERAGAREARAFVVTMNPAQATERTVHAILKLRPDARILARAKDAEQAARLASMGAVEVVPEAIEASLLLGARLLEQLGFPDEAVDYRIERAREREMERLKAAPKGG